MLINQKDISHKMWSPIITFLGKTFITFLCLLNMVPHLNAQNTMPLGQISVAGRARGDSIQIRWAPTDMGTWQHLMTHGVYIDRYPIQKNNNFLPLAQRKQGKRLTPNPLFPAPEETFGRQGVNNRNTAIAGQAIYGESMNVSSSSSEVNQLLDQAQENENRFSFGLFSADQSWSTAILMALAFTDKTVDKAYTYVYRIVPAEPLPMFDAEKYGFVAIDASDTAPPPKIPNLAAIFGSRKAAITWPLSSAASYYTGYIIGRSTDGINFTRVNDLPFVPLLNGQKDDMAIYTDSLPENNRPYFYAVAGMTPFSGIGPYSDPVQGMGKDPVLAALPSISGLMPDTEGKILISWEFPTALEKDINHFHVRRSAVDVGPYEPISDNVPSSLRFYTDTLPLPSNYYVVTAYDKYNRPLSSVPRLSMLEDSIPPAIPANVRGVITDEGDIVVTWEPNEEPDLLGYRLYFSNDPNAEYTLASNRPETMNFYQGKTSLRSLSGEMYVKVISIDLRHNSSDFSEVAILTRPDTIPPSPPRLVKYTADTTAITLHWRSSSSGDVERHILYRKSQKRDTTWTSIAEFVVGDTISSLFVDKEIQAGVAMDYRLDAVDRAGLITSSKTMCASKIPTRSRAKIQKLTGAPDRTAKSIVLNWQFSDSERKPAYFEVFRATEGKKPRRVQTIPASAARIAQEISSKKQKKLDKVLPKFKLIDDGPFQMDTSYMYQLRVTYMDGSHSSRSELITINY